MKLILENRTDQHVEVRYTPPLRDDLPMTSGHLSILPRDTGTIAGSMSEVRTILDDLGRFGLVSAEGADRFDAMKDPHSAPWRGLVYRTEADG